MEKTLSPQEIHKLIEEIVHRIKIVLEPEAILMAGSFGKEAWLFSDNILLSDFEFVFVKSNKWSIPKKTELLKELNNDFPVEISLKGYLLNRVFNKIDSNYSRNYSGYVRLDFFDTFSSPNILYSSSIQFDKIKFSNSDLPSWEAWRLVVNRIGNLLELESRGIDDEIEIKYCWLKIYEAIADAFLIVNNKYDKIITQRLDSFSLELLENESGIDSYCKESYTRIKSALISRNKHDIKYFKYDKSNYQSRKELQSWLSFFEKRLSIDEKFNEQFGFHDNYLNNKNIQKKYLENNGLFAVYVSNLIRVLKYPELTKRPFKYNKLSKSWRHSSLLAISSLFHELSLNMTDLVLSRKIANSLFSSNNMNSIELKENIIRYWKLLR